MPSYALIDKTNSTVVDIVLWDGEGDLFSEYNTVLLDGKIANQGWIYQNGNFINPNPTPQPTNTELRKAEITALTTSYTADIQTLNIAWLAAAVNDGVNETNKKDAVISQINSRKAKYNQDVADVIAKYPV